MEELAVLDTLYVHQKTTLCSGHTYEVIRLRRPYTFGPDKLDVTVHGTLASVVRVEPTFMKPVLNINDANDERVLRVKGPINFHASADFKIYTNNKTCIGCIRKEWRGLFQEMFLDANNFVITFPWDLDVHFKAAIIGACFLIVSDIP
ncbi:hypothetical protein K1T71_002210 [Dendrolimus kikuchii]|uniref:Uncharacterized protein n=1 Tax=Dendrolimus kikuchii TaxID=765133 RepID=A0ACC1DG44_9NEOP|nr:hypothetical protein K1T71_002210 [Dendrolimus kikuchii]